jgi:hypothetical protein
MDWSFARMSRLVKPGKQCWPSITARNSSVSGRARGLKEAAQDRPEASFLRVVTRSRSRLASVGSSTTASTVR